MENLINALANARINETINGEVEQWRAIDGYDGDYWVSSLGRVISIKSKIIMSPTHNGKGYKYVTLSKNRNKKNNYIHRLVASAFIENPDNLKEADHIDRTRANNCVSNLRWVSTSTSRRNK